MGSVSGICPRCRARWPTQDALKDAVVAYFRQNLIKGAAGTRRSWRGMWGERRLTAPASVGGQILVAEKKPYWRRSALSEPNSTCSCRRRALLEVAGNLRVAAHHWGLGR